ncbi:RNA polymerase II subunit A C-terminal domain phosphatase SSU72-like [Tubulanus polymorphus]|uniref:RNA polymerase II subunit A C-terminal domain phosphatase SSU72-like n=1 Tax=Tubulanus polymorphus TaxID=672921 RepID=UPI003DA42BA8
MPQKISFAVVCSSNQNRSMETHNILSKRGFKVRSFGSGNQVKLPGPTFDKPNIYDFNTSYEEMYRDLMKKDNNLYTQNGMLHMLDRNRRIKTCPERFQGCQERFNVILTCEERVFDQVLEDLESREVPSDGSGVYAHIINMDIIDNPEDATIGAFLLYDLCTVLEDADDYENDMDEILQEFETQCNRTILHSVKYY